MKLLVFAHIPPPHHGQSYMVKLLLESLAARQAAKPSCLSPEIECFHVNAQFSTALEDVGEFRPAKMLSLLRYCAQAWFIRIRHGVKTFYYVPAPSQPTPLYRDWVVMALCRPFFPQIIFHWHAAGLGGWLETEAGPVTRWLSRLLLGRANVSIVLSEYNRADAEKLEPQRVAVVANGIPDLCPSYTLTMAPRRNARQRVHRALLAGAEPAPADLAAAGAQPDIATVLFLALCTREKGIFDAFAGVELANQALRDAGKPLRFAFKAAGSFVSKVERDEFDRLLRESADSALHSYSGFLSGEGKKQALQAADVFCFPTYYRNEGQPVNLIEAMAVGLPLVTTRWRSIPEFLPADYPGFSAPEDPSSVAAALPRALTEVSGDQLRRAWLQRFTLDRYVSGVTTAVCEAAESAVAAHPPERPGRVRILYANNSADLYGASRSLLRILRTLDRTRFEPLVLLPTDGPLVAELQRLNVETRILSELGVITRAVFHSLDLLRFLFRLPRAILAVRRVIARENIALVHTNTGVILAPGLAARLARVPHLWHIRDWFQEYKRYWGFYEAWIMKFSALVLVVSEAMATQFSDRSKVRVIHNGFDIAEFALDREPARAAFRESHRLEDAPVIGCVGRIKLERKGQEVLLHAAAMLQRRGVKAHYLIVGAPYQGNENHLAALREIVRANALDDAVIFSGELADPRPAYAAMDIFVLPSAQPEPFGGVVMEAMCLGLPVVATNVGGSIEQVVDGETGFLVPPADAVALADRLEQLVKDPAMRERFGAAGRRRIVERFLLKEMVAKIERVYDECLNAR